MLKIYVYGYLNQVQSSRVASAVGTWSCLAYRPPGAGLYFRRDNGPAIRRVCAQFVALCRNLHLLDVGSVAIDGSKFKAVNHREKNFTHARRDVAAIEGAIDRYLAEIDRADRQQDVTGVPVPATKVNQCLDPGKRPLCAGRQGLMSQSGGTHLGWTQCCK